MTLHIYVEGEHPGESTFKASREARNALMARGHKVVFVGADVKQVQKEPTEQLYT